MAQDISAGEHFIEGELCSAQRLNDHVGDAEILTTFISTKPLKTEITPTDEFIINDSGTFKKTTIASVLTASSLPAGVVVDYAGLTAPVGWQLCYGQTLSRTTFANLFAAIGTTYGAGDGSTTFAVPDYRGRALIGKDDMGGTSANRVTSAFNGDTLGAVGGSETHTLSTAEMASHTHVAPSHVHNSPAHVHGIQPHTHSMQGYTTAYPTPAGGIQAGPGYALAQNTTAANAFQNTDAGGNTQTDAGNSVQNCSFNGSNGAHNNVQPSIVANKIIKV